MVCCDFVPTIDIVGQLAAAVRHRRLRAALPESDIVVRRLLFPQPSCLGPPHRMLACLPDPEFFQNRMEPWELFKIEQTHNSKRDYKSTLGGDWLDVTRQVLRAERYGRH
jgi:hypothetical protein